MNRIFEVRYGEDNRARAFTIWADRMFRISWGDVGGYSAADFVRMYSPQELEMILNNERWYNQNGSMPLKTIKNRLKNWRARCDSIGFSTVHKVRRSAVGGL